MLNFQQPPVGQYIRLIQLHPAGVRELPEGYAKGYWQRYAELHRLLHSHAATVLNFVVGVVKKHLGTKHLEAVAATSTIHDASNAVDCLSVGVRDSELEVVKDLLTPVAHGDSEVNEGIGTRVGQLVIPLIVACLCVVYGGSGPDRTEGLLGRVPVLEVRESVKPRLHDHPLESRDVLFVVQQDPAIILQLQPTLGRQCESVSFTDALHGLVGHPHNVELVHDDLRMGQHLVDSVLVGRPHVHGNHLDSLLVFDACEVGDDVLLAAAGQHFNQRAFLHVGHDATELRQDVDLVQAHPLRCLDVQALQLHLGEASEDTADGRFVDAQLASHGRELSLHRTLDDVVNQALGHHVRVIHVRDRLIQRLPATLALEALPVGPDDDVAAMHGQVEVFHALRPIADGRRQATGRRLGSRSHNVVILRRGLGAVLNRNSFEI